jgi:hypothetical protein
MALVQHGAVFIKIMTGTAGVKDTLPSDDLQVGGSRIDLVRFPVHFERHRPEQTTLYRLVQQHAASCIAHTGASTGSELPGFINDEFDAFLECSILAHGFLRLGCGHCGHDTLVAFSCKRRGLCRSCGARRMDQSVARLVDRVFRQLTAHGGKLTARNLPFVGVGFRCIAGLRFSPLLTFNSPA